MAEVYVIYSQEVDRFYIGSCVDFAQRIDEHNNHIYNGSFTQIAADWELFWILTDLEREQARRIEKHIKSMKSRVYLTNLKNHPDIGERLRNKYAGSPR